MQRQESAVEQGIMKQSHGQAETHHVERDKHPRPPGRGDCAAREPGGASSHGDAYQEKHAERMLVSEEIGDGEMHVPVPTFVSLCSTRSYERRNQRDTSNYM